MILLLPPGPGRLHLHLRARAQRRRSRTQVPPTQTEKPTRNHPPRLPNMRSIFNAHHTYGGKTVASRRASRRTSAPTRPKLPSRHLGESRDGKSFLARTSHNSFSTNLPGRQFNRSGRIWKIFCFFHSFPIIVSAIHFANIAPPCLILPL